jgi:hypothetical protein
MLIERNELRCQRQGQLFVAAQLIFPLTTVMDAIGIWSTHRTIVHKRLLQNVK